jgi:hypothetical protein
MKYVELDPAGAPTGRSASFVGIEFQPLRYTDLHDKKLGDKVVIPLIWKDARVLESTIPEITVDEIASGNAELESTYSSRAIGLVKGGWLPSWLAHKDNMVVLPDRCTVSEIARRFQDGEKTKADDQDFLDFFQGKRIRINPLLYALEGNRRESPSPELVEEQWEEACRKIKAALPLAQLTPDSKGGLRGVIGLLEDTRDSMRRKERFLLCMATRLQAPVSASRRHYFWNEVLTIAKECGVPKNSLVVLAALSAVCVANGASPAKRLLKPSANYSAKDAYNALADLRSLEVLINLFAVFPNERLMLCTGDKNLALFWAGMRASNFVWSNGHVSYMLSPVDALLPNVNPDLLKSYLDA